MKLDKIRDWYVANSGYVLQLAMPYYEELTVRENLTLAAQMRLSSSLSMYQKHRNKTSYRASVYTRKYLNTLIHVGWMLILQL